MNKTILDLIYPPRCPICDKVLAIPDRRQGICPSCVRTLPWIRGPVCLKCGKPLADERKEYCASCSGREHLFIQGRSTFRYEKAIRDSVLRMKFHNRREYLDFYAKAMSAAAEPFLQTVRPAVLLTVPMHPKKIRERGFDQCRLLGMRFSAISGIPMMPDAIVRIRYTLPQKGLDPEERRKNLRQAFAVNRMRAVREPVLLLDDIYTTGTTADAVCAVLNQAGVRLIYILTLCISVAGEEE